MEKIISFLQKRRRLFTIFLTTSTLLLSYWIIAIIKSSTAIKEGVSYKSITPGKTGESSIEKELGKPVKTKTDDGREIMEYQSSSPVRTHRIVAEEKVVQLIKEVVTIEDDQDARKIREEHGDPPHKLFNQDEPSSAFLLYVYPSKGLAYLGHIEDNTVLEIWYFPPTDLQNFILKWAPNYSLNKPALRQQ